MSDVQLHYQRYFMDNRLNIWHLVSKPTGDYTEIFSDVMFEGKYYENALVARRYEEMFPVVSCWISPLVSRDKLSGVLYKTALKFRYINKDRGMDLCYGYLDALCRDFLDRDNLLYDREVLYGFVEAAYDTDVHVDEISELRRYKWIGKFAMLPTHLKSRIRMKHLNRTTTEENTRKVESAVYTLAEMKHFITSANIAEVSELSVRTVERYVPMYKEEIDSYNMSNFDTTNFHSYTKDQNVYRIIDAIREATALEKKLSKTDLAEATELTRMTIHRLWNDRRIQEVMTKYNKELV